MRWSCDAEEIIPSADIYHQLLPGSGFRIPHIRFRIIHFSWREILGRALVKSFQQVSVEEGATLRHQSRHLIKTPPERGCNKRLTSSKAIHQKTQPKCQRKKYRNAVCVLKRGRSNYPWVLGGQKTTRRFDITLNATPQRGTATPVFSTAGPTKGLLFMHELLW